MKRWVFFISIPIFILGLSSWGIYRLLWTPDGVRWLFKTVSRYSSFTLSAEKINGRLAARLQLQGVKVVWPDGHLRIEKLQTRLKPGHLFKGTIVFEEIALKGISLEDQKVKTEPLDLSLPKISGLFDRVGIEVQSFRLEDIRYRHLKNPPLIIKILAGRLSFKQRVLAVNPLWLEADLGRLQGNLGIGLSVPALWLDIHLFPQKPLLGLDHIVVQGKLTSVVGPEQLSGPIAIKCRAGTSDRILILTDLGIAPHRLNIRQISCQEKGRRGLVQGKGSIVFDQVGPVFQGLLTLEGVDFSNELPASIKLSGPLRFEGRPEEYSGTFDLKNMVRTWQDFRLAGSFQGKLSGLEVKLVRSEWLKGFIEGQVGIQWDPGISLHGSVRGREFRTEGIHPQWPGRINVDARGDFLWSASGLKQGNLLVDLLESRFQGKELQGGLKARLDKDTVTIDRADLRGRGFSLSGQGVLSQGLGFQARVGDLAAFLPDSRGSLATRGWVRWRNARLAGRMTLEGKAIFWKGIEVKGLNLEAALDQEKPGTAVELDARVRKLVYRSFAADYLSGEVRGTLSLQKIALSAQGTQGTFQARLEGAYQEKKWKGTLVSLYGRAVQGGAFSLQAPAVLQVGLDHFKLSPCVLTGTPEERLTLSADLSLATISGALSVEWQQIDLSRIGSYLRPAQISGRTTGLVRAKIFGPESLDLQARADLAGTFVSEGRKIDVSRFGLRLDWDGFGLRSSFDLETTQGVRLSGQAASAEKGRPDYPDRVKVTARWEGLDVNLLKPEKPSGLKMEGQIGGHVIGEWTKGLRFQLKGGLKIAGGSLAWKEEGALLKAQVKKADVDVDWGEDRLKGNLSLELERYGKIKGDFSLPVPARFPVKMQPAGPMAMQIQGSLQEKGLLTPLFPPAALSGQGRLQGNLSARGTWTNPSLNGDLELTEAGADFKSLGIKVRDIVARATLNQDRISITSLTMRSGEGKLNGRATFWLKDWKIARLQGKVLGDHFQFINRPGLEAQGSPDLDFSGTPDKLVVGGVLEIPEGLISGGQPEGFKRASPDVQVVDAPAKERTETVFPIQGEIRLRLGQKVRLRAEGLDGFLRGDLRVRLKGSQDIKAFGDIQVVQGYYLLQGQKLQIHQGHFVFNGPPDNPVLDLLAFRTIRGRQRLEDRVDEVKAGIVVTGRLQSPLIKLYSQPPLSDTDILSYILFGQPLNQGAGQQNLALLGQAAKTLLGGKMQGSLAGKLALDTLEVQSDNADLSRSVVTVGKYLDPRLFLGLGGSMFSNSYQVILRYSLSRHLEVETKGGTQSGGGIYFKVDFE